MSYSIYPINPPNCKLPIIVSGIGYEENQPHVMRREGFPIPQIFICKSGKGILKVDNIDYEIEKGSFFYLTPNTPHEYYGTTDRWEVEWIIFTGNQLDTILTELNFNSTKVAMLNNFDKIEAYYKKIFVSLKSGDDLGKYISSNILYGILIEFYTLLYKEDDDKTSERNNIVNNIKHYINNHYNETLTLDELSELVDVTPQYLCKMFKRQLNLRPFQYIAVKRMQHAKILLTDSNMSVNEIAHFVGYNDCSYFCALFKKFEMISPSEFRGLKFK